MSSSPLFQDPPTTPELDRALALNRRLFDKIDEAIVSIEKILEGDFSDSSPLAGYSLEYRRKLALVRALVDTDGVVIVPELDPHAPRGHRCREIEESLSLEPGQGLDTLEELTELGILSRTFHNKVNLCPGCEHCQINFRETCPVCDSLELDVERILLHFSCAYSGVESEFRQGLELVCPKCRGELRQLGQDFERPHDVFVCGERHVFEDPDLSGQCLNCARVFPGHEVQVQRIHSYRPTHLAVRAVELNRLSGLDATELLYDANLKLASRDFLAIEIRRELIRLARYGGSFVTVSLHFEVHGRPVPIFRELTGPAMQSLGHLLVSSLRHLDLVSRLGNERLGLMLIETDDAGGNVVRDRLVEILGEMDLQTRTGQPMQPVWEAVSWKDGQARPEEVMAFFEREEEVQ